MFQGLPAAVIHRHIAWSEDLFVARHWQGRRVLGFSIYLMSIPIEPVRSQCAKVEKKL